MIGLFSITVKPFTVAARLSLKVAPDKEAILEVQSPLRKMVKFMKLPTAKGPAILKMGALKVPPLSTIVNPEDVKVVTEPET